MTVQPQILAKLSVAGVLCGSLACSSGAGSMSQVPDPMIRQQQQQIVQLQDSVQNLSTDLASTEVQAATSMREAEAARTQLSQANRVTQASMTGAGAGSQLLPPGATPGQCFARVFVPATYSTNSARVLVHDSVVNLQIIPARTQLATERVLVREATTRLEVVPATYEWKDQQVLVRPATTRLEEVPAQYETRTERLIDVPEHTIWKKGRGAIERIDEATGEIMCLVTVPATYKTVSRRVMVQGPSTREVTIPAEYQTVRQRAVKTPAATRSVEIPAVYDTVRVTRQVSAAREQRVVTPPVYETVTSQALDKDGYMEWRSILCETNVSPRVVSDLQRALSRAGHNPGPFDGVIGTRTMSAVRSYQRANDLASGQLTMETLTKLGVNLNLVSGTGTN